MTMTDLIDRQEAIRIASGYCHPANVVKELAKLPSAQQGWIEQIKWERDTAIAQLKELGYGLGEKMRTDADTISRQAAIDALHKKRIETMEKGQDVNHIWECLDVVAQLPSAQPEIIRCEDCKHGSPNGVYGCRLERFSYLDASERMYADDFCSKAERREDETD